MIQKYEREERQLERANKKVVTQSQDQSFLNRNYLISEPQPESPQIIKQEESNYDQY